MSTAVSAAVRLARLRRRLDRRVYRALFALYRAAFPAAGAAPRAADVRRLLVARVDRVGDLVLLSPALSYLRTALPGAAIEVLASRANASLLASDPRVDRVHVHEPTARGWLRSARALRARRFDVVLSVRLLDHLGEGLLAAAVAPRGGARVTARRPTQFAGLFTRSVRIPRSRTHVVDRLLYLARAALGDAPAGPCRRADDLRHYPPLLAEGDAAARRAADFAAERLGGWPYVAFNAWASDPRRGFGPAYAAALVAGIAARRPDLAVVLTPPPGREGEAAAILRDATARAPGAAARLAAAPTSGDLRNLVALVRRARAVVSPDTATVHVASALGTPLVAVYTDLAVEAGTWGAWGDARRVVHLRERRPPDAVPATAVLDALDDLLGAAPQVPAHASLIALPHALPHALPNALPNAVPHARPGVPADVPGGA